MRIAIPVANGKLAQHFGHCEHFALIDVDSGAKAIQSESTVVPPAHEPGLLPRWLAEQGATLIIAGGMGARAQQLFTANDNRVVIGARTGTPAQIVETFLAGTLETGENLCDH